MRLLSFDLKWNRFAKACSMAWSFYGLKVKLYFNETILWSEWNDTLKVGWNFANSQNILIYFSFDIPISLVFYWSLKVFLSFYGLYEKFWIFRKSVWFRRQVSDDQNTMWFFAKNEKAKICDR